MRRTLGLALLVLLVAAGDGRGTRAGGTAVAFVSVEGRSQLVAVDIDSRRVIGRVGVPNGPHNVTTAHVAGRELVLVTSPSAGRLTAVDARTRRVLWSIGGLAYPHDVETWHWWAYVTEEHRGAVAVVDLARHRVVQRVPVGAGPHDLAVRWLGRRVWVTHDPPGPITILDTVRARRAHVVGSGGGSGSHDIAFAQDGRSVWVTYWNSGDVAKIRPYPRRGVLLLRRRVGTLVHHVQADYDDRLWATDHASGATFRLSAATGRIVRTYRGCPGAHHVAPIGDTFVAVACHDANALAIFNQLTGRRFLVRLGGAPHGVAIAVL